MAAAAAECAQIVAMPVAATALAPSSPPMTVKTVPAARDANVILRVPQVLQPCLIACVFAGQIAECEPHYAPNLETGEWNSGYVKLGNKAVHQHRDVQVE